MKRTAKKKASATSNRRTASSPPKASSKKQRQDTESLKSKTPLRARAGNSSAVPAAGPAPFFAAVNGADANLNKIDHLVVLMMENRSFDHYLGYLKLEEGHASDGLDAAMFNQFQGKKYKVHHLPDTALKSGQDPNHDGASVTEQLLNNNGGFVANYAHTHPSDPEVDLVMGYYNKQDVPVLHSLAKNFCVCDRWFSSVDGATWPNRLYSLAGKAAGSKDNKSIPFYSLPTFVRHLDARGVTWNWYAHDVSTLRLVEPNYRIGSFDRFRWVEHPTASSFLRDAAAGTLPAVSWIDPDFSDLGFTGNDDHPPTDIRKGQELILKVAHAVQTSPQWNKTALVVVYDEHGGFFDHVVPPAAEDDSALFRSLGVRVPAVIVSPWTAAGSVSNTVYDHTSLIKTILKRFCSNAAGNIPDMGKRVAAAKHIGDALTRTSPATAANMTPVIANMASWKAKQFQASFQAGAEPRQPASEPNELQLGLSKARAKLRKQGLPDGVL